MFRAFPRTSAVIFLAMPLLFAACDELDDDVLLAPSGGKFAAPTVNTLVIPATTLPFQILPVLGCPFAPPFASRFSLLVDPIDVDVTMTEVSVQFVDTVGIVSPVSFNQNDLTVLFGSTHVAAGIQRTFPFQTNFGCNFQTVPHVLRGRAVFVNPNGHGMERTFEGRFGN